MQKWFWINAGNSSRESVDQITARWEAWQARGVVSVGFRDEPGKAVAALRPLAPGDRILAYVSGLGAVGAGVVAPGALLSVISEQESQRSPSLGHHRHVLAVNWDSVIDGIEDAVSPALVVERYGLFHPSSTRQQISQREHIDAASALIDECFSTSPLVPFAAYPDEVDSERTYVEGALTVVAVNRFERDRAARAACIAHYGLKCMVCQTSPEAVYGAAGRKAMHVHHVVPLSSIRREYVVDPINDLRPVCPTCHAVIHSRSGEDVFSIEEVQRMIARQRTDREEDIG
jgi:hypothetical protein